MTDAPPSYEAAIEGTDSSSSSSSTAAKVASLSSVSSSDEELRVREANVLRREQELTERERKAASSSSSQPLSGAAPVALSDDQMAKWKAIAANSNDNKSNSAENDGVVVTIDTDLKKPEQATHKVPIRGSFEAPVPDGLELVWQTMNTDGNTKYDASTYAIAGKCYDKTGCGCSTLDFVLFEDDRIKATVQFGGPSYTTCGIPCMWPCLPFIASWWYNVRRISFLIKADHGIAEQEIVTRYDCCNDEKKALFLRGIIQVLWQTARVNSEEGKEEMFPDLYNYNRGTRPLKIFELTGTRLIRAVTEYDNFRTFGKIALWRRGEDRVQQYLHDFVDRKSDRYNHGY